MPPGSRQVTQYANLLVRRAAEATGYRVPGTLAALSAEFRGHVERAAAEARVDARAVRAELARQRGAPRPPPAWAEESFAAHAQAREAVRGLPGPVTADQLRTLVFLESINAKDVTGRGVAQAVALMVRRPEAFGLERRPVQSRDDARAVVVRYDPSQSPAPSPPSTEPPSPARPATRPSAREVPSRSEAKSERLGEEFAKAAFARAAGAFRSGRAAAREAVRAILARLEPARRTVTVSTGRELERFLDCHERKSLARAHLAAFKAFVRGRGNPHERARQAERAFAQARSRDRLRGGSVVVVENLHGELTDRERRALARVCRKDKATLRVLEPIDMHRRHEDRVREFLTNEARARRGRADDRPRPPPPPPPPAR